MLWSKLAAALAFVPLMLAKPIAIRHRSDDDLVARSSLQPRTAGGNTYQVVSGDTGDLIAIRFSITFSTLSSANPRVQWTNLQVGQTLRMPSNRAPISHVGTARDSESSIANKFNVFTSDLESANPSTNWSRLGYGETIQVPGYGVYTTYSVTSGDTGSVIAQAYGIQFSDLSAANPCVVWTNLQVGQVLTIPAGVSPASNTLPSAAASPSQTSCASTTTTASATSTVATTSASTTSFSSSTTSKFILNPPIPSSSSSSTTTFVLNPPIPSSSFSRTTTSLPYQTTTTTTTMDTTQSATLTFSARPGTSSASTISIATTSSSSSSSTSPTATSPSATSRSTTTISSSTSTATTPSPSTTTTSSSTASSTTSSKSTTTSVTTSATSTSTTTKSTTLSTTASTTSSTTTTKSTTASTTASTTPSSTTTKSTTASTTASTTTSTTTSKSTTSSTTTTTSVNPTVEPTVTATATVTGGNYVTGGNNNDGVSSRADQYVFYQGDGSTADGWPAISQWLSFSTFWSNYANFLGQSCQSLYNVPNNSAQENQIMQDAIQQVATKSGVDHRLIFAIILQESSGCVRVPTTVSPDGTVSNPGLLQDFNGSGSCNKNGVVQTPCPASQIFQMVEDGVFGTSSNGGQTYLAGLVQDINSSPGYSGAQVIYRAARIYNSGSVPSSGDLGAPGATRCYASDIANLLMGRINAKNTCTLDG